MFLSYEYIYKLKSNLLMECINTTPKGAISIIKNKISLLCTIAAIETLVLILINSIFAISRGFVNNTIFNVYCCFYYT